MKKIIGIGIVLMLVTIGVLAGCTESNSEPTKSYTNVLTESMFQEVRWGWNNIEYVTIVLFEDDTRFRFNQGKTAELHLFCQNHPDETIKLYYNTWGNHYEILDFEVVGE